MNDRQTESEDLNFIVIKFVNCTRTHARIFLIKLHKPKKKNKEQRTKNKEQELTNKLTTIIKQFNYS